MEMDTKEFRSFGKRADNVGMPRQIRPIVVPPPRRTRADYGFSAVLGLLVLATIGFVGVMLTRPTAAADKTAAVSAVVEAPHDGGLITEPTRVDRAGERGVTYMVEKVTYEGAGVVNVISSRGSANTGIWFTQAKYDCNKGALFNLAGGESQSAMSTKGADYKWSYLVNGSSATMVARFACSKAGLKLYVAG
ncbi:MULTISPECIES: hypothetical protein [Mesorhizobium]|uniref:Uncharacterized protein n=1 Tax=Mesorhizobium temperatum TaxID=241416 RepID=A0A271LBC1_9HYPH|nr:MULTISPECIES: hypothetical protein [Mesorhizobium]PAQ05393.1 hypothetical protein CIT26_30205 [Mesorhizobium temperatum]